MLVFALVLSALLLVVSNVIAFRSRSATLASWTAFAFLLFGIFGCTGMLFLPVFLLNAASVAVVGFICAVRKAKASQFLVYSLVATLFSYGLVSAYSLAALNELSSHYRAIPLQERLSYEAEPRSADLRREASRVRPDSILMQALEDGIDQEQQSWSRQRPLALKEMHEKSVLAFVSSPGFGVSRGIPVLQYAIALPAISSIPQPATSSDPSPDPVQSRDPLATAAEQPLNPALRSQDYRPLHRESVLSFVNASGFGYIAGRRQVVGFQEHHFRAASFGEPGHRLFDVWRVQRVELVSLLRHPEPRVYRSDNLPRMDELRKAKTRPLDGFEASALPELLKGDDLTSRRTGDAVRVLGAIRAVRQCLDCHSVKRGELLGAFSYRLHPSVEDR